MGMEFAASAAAGGSSAGVTASAGGGGGGLSAEKFEPAPGIFKAK